MPKRKTEDATPATVIIPILMIAIDCLNNPASSKGSRQKASSALKEVIANMEAEAATTLERRPATDFTEREVISKFKLCYTDRGKEYQESHHWSITNHLERSETTPCIGTITILFTLPIH